MAVERLGLMKARQCRTGKRRYRDRIGALIAMASARHKDGSNRGSLEQRAYRCPFCTGWHLTSQSDRRRQAR